jgi:deoxyribodipyrimidine photo-lyase
MTNAPIVVWYRQDLRIRDQAALAAAADTGRPVVPLYPT